MADSLLRVLACGSVDDGKSTLLGRLLIDTGCVPDDVLEEAGEPARLFDGLIAEREQGITIDVAYRYFSTPRRSFVVADAPGHEQYLRNMVTGASVSDLALVLVDVRHGVRSQTRRHALITSLLGIRHLMLVVNKMDAVDYAEAAFQSVVDEFRELCGRLAAADVQCVPVAALAGDNVVHRSAAMPWYDGPTVLHVLESVHVATGRNAVDLRVPIQAVVRDPVGGRWYQGTVASGLLRVGDDVVVLPSGQRANVAAILGPAAEVTTAAADVPASVRFDREVDVSRGDLVVHARNQPVRSHAVEAMVVWLGQEALSAGVRLRMKHLTRTTEVTVRAIEYRLDVDTLRRVPGGVLHPGDVGRCVIEADAEVCWDPYDKNRVTGAAILLDPVTRDTVAAMMFIDRLPSAVLEADVKTAGAIRPVVAWLTGLSGAGKSTIAEGVRAQLAARGVRVVVLDGDRLRQGLNRDLGFSEEDRRENVRRVAEVARLFMEEGCVVLVPVIAPFATDRAAARDIVGADHFLEVFVDASLDVCEARDVKGLYRRARAGDLPAFTGISSPYEAPVTPDLVLPTGEWTTEACVQRLNQCLSARRRSSA
jgi:bifunctional enzyme CysN/CysC